MRRTPSNLLIILAALTGVVGTACQSGGVGDPCIPEDEYSKSFSGYSATEVNVESRSFQCETRVCLVANFAGRVSCPYGQKPRGTSSPTEANSADKSAPADDQCYLPGKKQDPANSIDVPVAAQLLDRPPDKAVYCSCRCDGPDKNVRYCQCPSGYACQKLVTDYGFGSGQLAGSYCIKDGTQVVDSTVLDNGTACDKVTPGPRPSSCGPKHPAGI